MEATGQDGAAECAILIRLWYPDRLGQCREDSSMLHDGCIIGAPTQGGQIPGAH